MISRRDARLSVLEHSVSARRGVAPTPLARRPGEEAAPIALPAPDALSALVAVRHLDLAPVVPSNQATPVFRHDGFLPWFENVPLWTAASRRGVGTRRAPGPKSPKRDARIEAGPREEMVMVLAEFEALRAKVAKPAHSGSARRGGRDHARGQCAGRGQRSCGRPGGTPLPSLAGSQVASSGVGVPARRTI